MESPELRSAQFALANGVNVLAVEQPGTEAASIQVWCQTGSINEGRWVGAGLTHLLEHMLFKGTARRTAVQISDEIHEHGGYLNAYTSFDRTVFWVDCPRSAVGPSLEVLGDMIFRSTIDPGELNREMDVIRREFEMGYDDPDRTLSQLTFATAFNQHPCRFPVIGLREIFDRIDHDAVMDYYRRRYVPNNLYVVVVANLPAEQVHAEVNRAFGFAPVAPIGSEVLPEEPRQIGRRSGLRAFNAELAYFNLAFHIPALFHQDMPALDVASVILGGGISSVLYKHLREEKGLVYGIGAFSYTPAFPGLLTISGTCSDQAFDSVEPEIMSALSRWQRDGLTQKQLDKAKRMIWVNAMEHLQTARGVAADVGLNWLYTRNVNFSTRYLEQVRGVTADEVTEVSKRYLTDDNLSVVGLRPKVGAPSYPAVRPREAETELIRVGPQFQVLLMPDDRLPLLYGSAVFRGGVLAESPAQTGLARLHSQCAVRATRDRSANALADEIEGLGGSLSGDSGYNSLRFAVNTLTQDADRLVDLLFDVMTNPSFPPEIIDRERESQVAAFRAEEAQPHLVARNLLRSVVYRNHPYGRNVLGTPEAVNGFDRTELQGFHQQLVGGGEGVLAFRGGFDRRRLMDRLEAALAGRPFVPIPAASAPAVPPLEPQTIIQHESRNQAVVAFGFLGCSMFDPDRVGFEILDEATGDSSSRFFIRIREELGLAYTVGTSLSLGFSSGLFTVYAATSPKAVDTVVEVCREQLAGIGRDGLSEREFQRAKTRLSVQLAFQRQNLDGYAHATALNVLYGLGPHFQEARQKAIEHVTPEQIQAVCHKYLMDKPFVTVIVRP
ncbi:MAG TPA: pitrilysin family protein [Chthoniobacterales bacterium]